ncbi:MAG TPA: hypothetical protein VMS22_04560, partial [Candidatus Eisenbacteria bacterium]|nr:hypothetical protein [Candidatus Eisenbacteria bacterium]
SECDATEFDPDPSKNDVSITFPPAGPTQPPAIHVVPDSVECTAGGSPCTILRFTMPDTRSAAVPDGFAGPAEISVTTPTAGEVAHIGPLFEPHEVGATCDRQPAAVFQQFTVLPQPNNFKDIAGNLAGSTPTQALATLDGGGNLLVPIDWVDALPAGSGAPVAALVAGTLNVDAFPGTPGPVHVTSDDVRSFTIDAKPLPPLIRVTDAGNSVFGTSDANLSVIRVARVGALGQPNFNLGYLLDSSSRGPIVFKFDPPMNRFDFSFGRRTSVPLNELKSSSTGAVFATDEAIEARDPTKDSDLNDDGDSIDQVVQFTETKTGTTISSHMAASHLNNPIVGPAALAIGDNLAAFIQGEANENAGGQTNGTDLNLDGQTTDDLLRVFSLQDPQGPEVTPDAPAELHPASLFPAISRNPVAVDGDLVYYRTPDVQLGFPTNLTFADPFFAEIPTQHLAVTRDGRYFVGTAPNNCGAFVLQHRDGASGLTRGRVAYFVDDPACRTAGVGDVVISGSYAYAASPDTNTIIGVDLGLQDGDSLTIGSRSSFAQDGVAYRNPFTTTSPLITPTGLQGVTRLAIARSSDASLTFGRTRISLYALSPAKHAVVAFNASVDLFSQSSRGDYVPPMIYSQTMLDDPATCPPYTSPSPTLTCIGPMADARNLTVSPDGKFVYVAVHGTGGGSGIIKLFERRNNSPNLDERADTYIEAALDVAVSPDGAQLYAISGAQGSFSCAPFSSSCATLWTFNRDAVTGALGFVGAIGIPFNSNKLVISPDGKSLHVVHGDHAAESYNGLTTFARNTATGALSFVQHLEGGINTSSGLPELHLIGVTGAVMSPDSEHLYTQGYYTAVNIVGVAAAAGRFSRTSHLHAFDATTQLDRPGLDSPTNVAAVAAGHAAWLSPGYLNAFLVNLYDAATGTTTNLSLTPNVLDEAQSNQLALSSQAVVWKNIKTPAEIVLASTSPPYTKQRFGSNDATDLAATDVCAGGDNDGDPCTSGLDCPDGDCGAVVVFTLPSSIFGKELVVHRALDPTNSELITIGGIPTYGVADFQVSGNIVAFRLDEMHFADWNHDGDRLDLVMFAYDLKSRRTFETRMASKSCQVAGCDPGLSYKIRDGAIFFTTFEPEQGCQPPATNCIVDTDSIAPLGGGVDLNGDGQLGTVLQIFADTDGDGVFDDQDNCRSVPNTNQLDTDNDTLGDVCDPSPTCFPLKPDAPSAAPTAATACQKAIGSASRSLLKTVITAQRKCLDRIAGGKLTGDPNQLCRGALPAVVPTDLATGTKITKAATKLQTTLTSKCPDATLAQLAACGNTGAALDACVLQRVGTAATTVTNLLYGTTLAAVAAPAALSCQKAIGKAGATEVVDFTKANDGCLDAINAGKLSGDSQVMCLGEWKASGSVAPLEVDAAGRIDKAAAKAARTIGSKCSPAALAPLQACGGGTAAGVADCLRCAAFSQVTSLVEDTY